MCQAHAGHCGTYCQCHPSEIEMRLPGADTNRHGEGHTRSAWMNMRYEDGDHDDDGVIGGRRRPH